MKQIDARIAALEAELNDLKAQLVTESEESPTKSDRRGMRQLTQRLPDDHRQHRVEGHRQRHPDHHGDRPAVARRQDDRGEHRLVGELGQEHDAEGDEEGLQHRRHQPARC